MGANSAPRRQNCRGWEKVPLQDWETLSPLLPFSHKDEAESHHPLWIRRQVVWEQKMGPESKVR